MWTPIFMLFLGAYAGWEDLPRREGERVRYIVTATNLTDRPVRMDWEWAEHTEATRAMVSLVLSEGPPPQGLGPCAGRKDRFPPSARVPRSCRSPEGSRFPQADVESVWFVREGRPLRCTLSQPSVEVHPWQMEVFLPDGLVPGQTYGTWKGT